MVHSSLFSLDGCIIRGSSMASRALRYAGWPAWRPHHCPSLPPIGQGKHKRWLGALARALAQAAQERRAASCQVCDLSAAQPVAAHQPQRGHLQLQRLLRPGRATGCRGGRSARRRRCCHADTQRGSGCLAQGPPGPPFAPSHQQSPTHNAALAPHRSLPHHEGGTVHVLPRKLPSGGMFRSGGCQLRGGQRQEARRQRQQQAELVHRSVQRSLDSGWVGGWGMVSRWAGGWVSGSHLPSRCLHASSNSWQHVAPPCCGPDRHEQPARPAHLQVRGCALQRGKRRQQDGGVGRQVAAQAQAAPVDGVEPAHLRESVCACVGGAEGTVAGVRCGG